MALSAYLYVTGQKSGAINGSITQKGREGSIAVYAVAHGILSPRDAASGLPTGKRQHKPLVITKEIDKSSPLLINVLVTNENLKEVILKFWAPQLKAASGVGAEVNYYNIKLTNANIDSIETDMQNNKTDPGTALAVLERISFVYQKIEWTWVDGGIMSSDNWQTTV